MILCKGIFYPSWCGCCAIECGGLIRAIKYLPSVSSKNLPSGPYFKTPSQTPFPNSPFSTIFTGTLCPVRPRPYRLVPDFPLTACPWPLAGRTPMRWPTISYTTAPPKPTPPPAGGRPTFAPTTPCWRASTR
jgi:hypothetical protein